MSIVSRTKVLAWSMSRRDRRVMWNRMLLVKVRLVRVITRRLRILICGPIVLSRGPMDRVLKLVPILNDPSKLLMMVGTLVMNPLEVTVRVTLA